MCVKTVDKGEKVEKTVRGRGSHRNVLKDRPAQLEWGEAVLELAPGSRLGAPVPRIVRIAVEEEDIQLQARVCLKGELEAVIWMPKSE